MVIHQTTRSVASGSQTPRKNEAQSSFSNQLQGIWKSEETIVRVLDIASQTIHNSWRNSKQKLTIFMIITFPNLFHSNDFLWYIAYHKRSQLTNKQIGCNIETYAKLSR